MIWKKPRHIVMIGYMSTTKMHEKEIEQLINGLKRSRDGFTHRYGKTPEQAIGRRMTKRDRELMDAFRNR